MNDVKVDFSVCHEYKKSVKEIFSLFYKRDFNKIKETIEKKKSEINNLKQKAKNEKNEILSNQLFVLGYYLELLNEFNNFYMGALELRFEGSWFDLQSAQNILSSLYRLTKNSKEFCLDEIGDYFDCIEKLYPYRLFVSREAIVHKICTLCKKNMLNHECFHQLGELYMGEMAIAEIKSAKLIQLALVENPVDKRCVIEPSFHPDKKFPLMSAFGVVYSFALNSVPFQKYEIEFRKTIIKRENLKGYDPQADCPCRSRKKYGGCCSKKRVWLASEEYVKKIDEKICSPFLSLS